MSDDLLAATSAKAFEQRYRDISDPWDFATSSYERGKYDVTIAALSHARYGSAFEPGCSIGELTARLALRCDHLLASDFAQTAVARARERCAHLPNVTVECANILDLPTEQSFDLIVLSEVGYYFAAPVLADLAKKLSRSLAARGELLAVHWLGSSADHVLHGDEVHRTLRDHVGIRLARAERHDGFRLDVWRKA